jgi:hypothetical protein
MSIRLEMLQVARLATKVLGESAELVEGYVRSQQNADGGFSDREGVSDLYYTSFAIDALTALQTELPVAALRTYLESRGDGDGLDFVHLCCLARCWSAVERHHTSIEAILSKIEGYRTADGGYNQTPDAETSSAYGSFLAYGAYADHGGQPPALDALEESLRGLLHPEMGAWANDRMIPVPSVLATAAAVTVWRNLRVPIPKNTVPWILGCLHPQGGFMPFPGAPMPDLLSTAVALHALDGLQAPLLQIQEVCLDYIDTLWTAEGGFFGNWEDDELDIEYTYYGLLALGHLSL